MLHGPPVALAVGADEGAEAEGQCRVVVQRQRPIEHFDSAVVITGEVGANERAHAHRLRVVAVHPERDVGVSEGCRLVGEVKPVAQEALLVTPRGIAVRCDEVRLELDGPGYYWYGSTTGNDEGRGLTGAIVVSGEVPPEAKLDRPPQPRP